MYIDISRSHRPHNSNVHLSVNNGHVLRLYGKSWCSHRPHSDLPSIFVYDCERCDWSTASGSCLHWCRAERYLSFHTHIFFVFCCAYCCAYWRGIIVKLTKMHQDVVILTYAKFCNSMLASDGTGSSQSLNTARIYSNAILSHFIFEEKHKFWMNSIQKLFDIASQFFLRIKVHTYILFTWNPSQDFSIFSLYHDPKHNGIIKFL